MASSYDPFDSAEVLTIPSFSYEDKTRWSGFHFDKELQNAVFSLPDVEQKDLQDLQPGAFTLNLEEVPLSSLEASSASSYTTAEDDLIRDAEQLDNDAEQETWENVWTFPEVKDAPRELKLTSWDHFFNAQHTEPGAVYLSEAGASTFDAIIASHKPPNHTAPLVVPDRFLNPLYELGLGRSSILFQWSEEEHRFTRSIDEFTVTGCTPELVQNIVDSTAASGSLMRKLSEPKRHYRRDGGAESPGVLALYSELSSCLMAVQQYVDNLRYDIVTVLHFQLIYLNVVPLLELMNDVATILKAAESDHLLLASLLRNATSLSIRYPQFGPVLNHIISFVARPVLNELSYDVGLNARHCPTLEEGHTDEADQWTPVLPTEVLQTVQQTAHTLQLLQGDACGRLKALLPSRPDAKFNLAFSWASVIEIQTDADEYERNLKSGLLIPDPSATHVVPSLPPATGLASSMGVLTARGDPFELVDIEKTPPTWTDADPACILVLQCLNGMGSSTELALTHDEVLAQSISPLLFAQHRLLSYSIFELLFTEHKLLFHLTLQHQIQLLGNGMFAARLDTALFDSEQSSGEGRRRTGATTGLRLQTRDAWPPASSELRLVLMGVLSESMAPSGANTLEESVSFAIRELSEEELERCREVDSICAVDFLKLQYRPPNPVLEAVISSESLDKYDRIFQHLLRVLRLKGVAQGLLRDLSRRGAPGNNRADHKFRIEIQCFVSAVADYCQNVAVNRPWATFENTIRKIGEKLESRDYDGVLSLGQSLDNLRRKHEDTLDCILRALLLKRKQKQALDVLEETFGVVLRYAAALRKTRSDEEMPARYHVEFTDLVRRFVGLLQELGRSSDLKGSHDDGEVLFEELLLRLDYNGYWNR